MIRILSLTLLLALASSQVDPPTWPQQFSQVFIQGYNSTHIVTTGKIFYDAKRQMSRVDRVDGKNQQICGSIQPGVNTACSQLVRQGKRYIIFPERRMCCMCCDQAHGCGILKRDWLKEATYEGNQTLDGESFYKWSIPDGAVLDYYWATKTDQRIPRKLDEGGSRIKQFIMNTYSEQAIPDHIFQLPSYCEKTCAPSTVCGKFQSDSPLLTSE